MASYNDYHELGGETLISRNIFWGEVIENDDPYGNQTIKVRILELDQDVLENGVPFCYPLNSPYLYTLPQVGERVSVLLESHYNANKRLIKSKRYWIANTISRNENLEQDDFYYTANAHETNGFVGMKNPLANNPLASGLLPRKTDIAFFGRKNTEIRHLDNQITIKAGRYLFEDKTRFNNRDSALLSLRYNTSGISVPITQEAIIVEELDSQHSISLTIISDKVMLKVIDRSGEVLEHFSKTYGSDTGKLFSEVNEKINEFKKKYPLWSFSTNDDRFSHLPYQYKTVGTAKKQTQTTQSEPLNFNSHAAIVADKITLLSRNGAYKLKDTPHTHISDEQLVDIIEAQNPMVKGRELLQFLQLLKQAYANHVHPYHGLAVSKSEIDKQLLEFDLNKILNENIGLL